MLVPSSTSRICHLVTRNNSKLFLKSSRFLSTSPGSGHEECDVVIVGGGPAGLALASALGSLQAVRENLKVALVEGGDLSKLRDWSPKSGAFSNRVSSLTSASQAFLQSVGAWDHVEAERTAPIEEMQVWDGISDARINFVAEDLGLTSEDGMARLTENFNLQRALLRHLNTIPEIELIDKTRVQTIVRDADEQGGWPLIQLDSGRTLRTRLLVGADGLNSPVRSYAQIPSFGWSYDTQAIVATLIHEPRGAFQGPNTTAYQRFLPTGPIAFLPLSATSSSLVWSTKPGLASALLASDHYVLASMINAAFRLPEISLRYLHNRILQGQASGQVLTPAEIREEILWRERSHSIDVHSAYASSHAVAAIDAQTEAGSEIEGKKFNSAGIPSEDAELFPPLVTSILPGTVASFPLRFNHTEAYIGEGSGSRTVLVGDAAHTVHPLAGQGLNLGLADVECLAKCIETALKQGGDIGSYTALMPYAQERYLKNHTVMSAIDKLHKIYTSTAEPVVWARSVGVEVLNELDTVKAALMLTAGARQNDNNRGTSGEQRPDAAIWEVAAKGVESIVAANNAAKVLGSGLVGMVGMGLYNLLKDTYAAPSPSAPSNDTPTNGSSNNSNSSDGRISPDGTQPRD